jgi:tRNA U55 pseudouridine synthase TruB
MAQFISNSPKEYEASFRFGFSTNTYDREAYSPAKSVRRRQCRDGHAAPDGRLTTRCHLPFPPKRSRRSSLQTGAEGTHCELTAAHVEVGKFEMLAPDPPLMKFPVVCSRTYVRSLAHDLGQRLVVRI